MKEYKNKSWQEICNKLEEIKTGSALMETKEIVGLITEMDEGEVSLIKAFLEEFHKRRAAS